MIYLFLATCSSAVMAIVLRMFQDSKGNRYGIILGNYLVCILISFLSLPDRSLVLRESFVTIICGIIGGIFFVAGLVTMQTSTKLNGATLTAVFSKMGLVISLAVSIFVFGERPGPMQAAGVILVLAALVLINSSGEEGEQSGEEKVQSGEGQTRLGEREAKSGGEQDQPGKEQVQGKTDTSKVYTSALILTMLAGGGASSMSKIFEQIGSRDQDELYFLYLFATAAVLTVILAAVERRKTGADLRWQEMAAGIAVGVPNYYASFLLLLALVALPAFIVYPVNSTGAILLVMAVDALIFHQKYTSRQKIGILLVLAAMILLNI